MVGAEQWVVHVPVEVDLRGDQTGWGKGMSCKAGVGKQGEACGLESQDLDHSENPGLRMRPGPPALLQGAELRALAHVPTQGGACGERRRPKGNGLGREAQATRAGGMVA